MKLSNLENQFFRPNNSGIRGKLLEYSHSLDSMERLEERNYLINVLRNEGVGAKVSY